MPSAAVSEREPIADIAPIRVVFADDSAAVRTLARYALSSRRGFDVVAEAADGRAALDAFETFHPDCVVLDIEMPGMGGFEALAELRHRSPDLPVILLSGHTDRESEDRALACGAASYLGKTGSLSHLAEAVRRVAPHPVTGGDVAPTAEGRDDGPEPMATSDDPTATTAPTDPASPTVTTDVTDLAAELRRLEYVVSHDLGEPLRIMSGFSGLLDNRYADVLDTSGQAFLGHIVEAADRMQRMLDDLVAYSRAGRAAAGAETVDVKATVHRVYASLAPDIEERGAEVGVGDPPLVRGDAAMVETVLGHLVRNALMFNAGSPPTVRVDGRIEGGAAVITVTDNGIGIDPADQNRVFDLFVRLHARGDYPGTGTGLALCRRLLRLQGGTIAFAAGTGTGTTVSFTLPTDTD